MVRGKWKCEGEGENKDAMWKGEEIVMQCGKKGSPGPLLIGVSHSIHKGWNLHTPIEGMLGKW